MGGNHEEFGTVRRMAVQRQSCVAADAEYEPEERGCPTSPWRFVPASAVHVGALAQIERASPSGWSRDSIATALASRNQSGVVCMDGDLAVAHCFFAVHGSRIEILRLGVLRDCWRQGIGSAVLSALKEQARLEARKRVVCRTPADSRAEPLRALLTRCGFHVFAAVDGGSAIVYACDF